MAEKSDEIPVKEEVENCVKAIMAIVSGVLVDMDLPPSFG